MSAAIAPLENSLAHGWNTWNTRSALSQVLLPEAFALNLSFCHYGMLTVIDGGAFGLKEHRASAGVRLSAAELTPTKVGLRPGRHAYEGNYTAATVVLGKFSALVETARRGDRELVVLVTPTPAELRPPALIVEAALLWNRAGHVAHGDERSMHATFPASALTVHCTRSPGRDPNAGYRSPYWVFPLTSPVGLSTDTAITLEEITAIVAAAKRTESSQHERYGDLAELHAAYQACLAWNTIYDPSFDRVITTASRPWNVLRFGYGVFCWDSFFFTWLLAADQPALARTCALEVFREMIDGKFVPNVVNGSGRRSWDRSQPPVGSLCVLALEETAPDRDFLSRIFPSLLAWNRWWHEARRNADGLLSWGSNPFAPRIGDAAEFIQPATARGAALESGSDNSPMYDDIPLDKKRHVLELSDVGLVSLYILDCESLVAIARRLGEEKTAEELLERAELYRTRSQTLWNAAAGLFQNRRTDTGEFNPRLAPQLFYPLLAGTASPEQIHEMVNRHLLNEKEFWGEWVLPSVSRDDPSFAEQSYWRGCIWAPLNFLVYLGLKRAGCSEPAKRLSDRSRALFEKNWRQHGGVFENYSAIDGGRPNADFCDPLCTWSGLLILIPLLETGRLPLPSVLRPTPTVFLTSLR